MAFNGRVQILIATAYVLFVLSFNISFAEIDGQSYKQYLLKQALSLKLHEERYWHILLHYKKTLSGYESFIDDPKFFLSERGKFDPESELLATIEGFFQEPEENTNLHPKCRFIARYEWLKEKLNFNERQLPNVYCKEFEDIYSRLNARSASLIFPTSYPNSPASMFGHTLIRLEGEYHSPLLAYAVNYSAIPEDDFALIYTFKGIFGYYKGIFTALPYYDKVREYSDIERRDIWEYNLNLTSEEVRKMVLHLWELKDVYQYYYFFDENCSYNILFLLESARPSIKLIDKFRFWVIPVDTIRAVEDEGLVEKKVFRPSIYSRIKFLSGQLDTIFYKEVSKILDGIIKPDSILDKNYSDFDKQKILELTAEILQYQYFKENITKEEYRKKFYEVLTARSKLPINTNNERLKEPISPELGHESIRLKFGGGFYDSKSFFDLSIRPAYHDFMNNDDGYIEGSQIIFTDLSLRYFFSENQLKLKSLDLIDIISLTPIDYFNKPFSWRVKTGFERKKVSTKDDDIVYNLEAGGGFSFKKWSSLVYFLINGSFGVSGGYGENFVQGVGFNVGLIKKLNSFGKIFVNFEMVNYILGDEHKKYNFNLNQSLFLKRNLELNIQFKREKDFKVYNSDFGIYLNYFFR